jgi:S-adenosylmethionine synthetase
LRPDAKRNVRIQHDEMPTRIDAIVISTQHDDFDEESIMLAKNKKRYCIDFDS